MARLDLHRRDGRALVDVQADIMPALGTRLVIPLFELDEAPRAMDRLHPILPLDGKRFVLATHLMAAVPTIELGPVIGSADEHYDTIVGAIGVLLNGF